MVMLISDAAQGTGVTPELIRNSVPVLKPKKGVFPKGGDYIVLGKHIVKLVGDSDCTPLDLFDDEIYSGRYMAATNLPYVDASGKVESGVCCIGCEMAHERHFQSGGFIYDELEPIFKVYSHQGFLNHFYTCPRAQKQLLDSRNDGEVQDDTMKFISRHGWPVDENPYIMSEQVMD